MKKQYKKTSQNRRIWAFSLKGTLKCVVNKKKIKIPHQAS